MSEELQVAVVQAPSVITAPTRDVQVVVRDEIAPLVLESPETEIVTLERDVHVVQGLPDVQIVTVGEQGPGGATGGLGTSFTKPSGVDLGGHRAVVLNDLGEAIYADNTTLTHRDKVLGVTLGASVTGADATIVSYGEITEPSWNWTLDEPVFVGANGLLTQTAPTSAGGAVFLQRVGFPNGSPHTLFVDIDTAITL